MHVTSSENNITSTNFPLGFEVLIQFSKESVGCTHSSQENHLKMVRKCNRIVAYLNISRISFLNTSILHFNLAAYNDFKIFVHFLQLT